MKLAINDGMRHTFTASAHHQHNLFLLLDVGDVEVAFVHMDVHIFVVLCMKRIKVNMRAYARIVCIPMDPACSLTASRCPLCHLAVLLSHSYLMCLHNYWLDKFALNVTMDTLSNVSTPRSPHSSTSPILTFFTVS